MSNFNEKLYEAWARTEAQVHAASSRVTEETPLADRHELARLRALADRQYMALWESQDLQGGDEAQGRSAGDAAGEEGGVEGRVPRH